jgi:hypothetical protein
VRQIFDAIFADIIENDTILEFQTDACTQCFLVHLSYDLDTEGSFLSQFHRLPHHALELDHDHGLSFASSWLQASLEGIRDGHNSEAARLQMPFCVLETEYHATCVRAYVLQSRHPNEKVTIATLDIMALKNAKLVASAEHTFKMLRVSSAGIDLSQRLLVWAGGMETGIDDQNAQALRQAVLATVEWHPDTAYMDFPLSGKSAKEIAEEQLKLNEAQCDLSQPGVREPTQKKKDSVITNSSTSELSSKPV